MSSTTYRSVIPVLCAVALLSAPGCTTTRTLDPQSQPSTTGELKAGDTVKVTLQDGTECDITFVEQTPESITGRDGEGGERTTSRQDISFLQVESISTGRTLLLVGGVVLLIGVVQAVGETVSAFDCFLGGSC